jgi:hypothetical protein
LLDQTKDYYTRASSELKKCTNDLNVATTVKEKCQKDFDGLNQTHTALVIKEKQVSSDFTKTSEELSTV